MEPNVNPETGIRYGIISANSLTHEIVNEIQERGTDLNWEAAVKELEREVKAAFERGDVIHKEDFQTTLDRATDDLANHWYDDEPVHEFEIDGVKGRTTWLGGALHVWIFESPFTDNFKLCSPCVPNCGDLDSPDVRQGYTCYDVPDDWRRDDEGWYEETDD